MQIIHITVKSFQHCHFASFKKRFTFVLNSSAKAIKIEKFCYCLNSLRLFLKVGNSFSKNQNNTLAPYMVKKTEESAAKKSPQSVPR